MNRHLLALAAATTVTAATALTVLTASTAASAASAPTLGPVAVGWWSTANRDPAVPMVSPPDVGPRDLYVAGSNALPAELGVLGSTAGPVAIAGLSFQLPAGVGARKLQVRLAGTHPPTVTMTACRALQPFAAVYGGSWVDAPTYDCRDAGTARLDVDGTVVLDGVDRLRRGRDLHVVLVPGPLDRVVVAAPDIRTLTVSTPPPPPTSGAVSTLPPARPVPPPASSDPGSGVGLPMFGSAPLPAGHPPVAVQPTAVSTAPVPVVAAPAATVAPLPVRPWQALLATLLLALLAFVPLVRQGGAGTVGQRGVGRFRSERSGTVPDLS